MSLTYKRYSLRAQTNFPSTPNGFPFTLKRIFLHPQTDSPLPLPWTCSPPISFTFFARLSRVVFYRLFPLFFFSMSPYRAKNRVGTQGLECNRTQRIFRRLRRGIYFFLRAASYFAWSIPQPIGLASAFDLELDVVFFGVRFVIVISKHFDDHFQECDQEPQRIPEVFSKLHSGTSLSGKWLVT